MSHVVLVGLNTRHTHSSLSLACLQSFWERIPDRPKLTRIDHDLNLGNEALISKLVLLKPSLVAFATYIWNIPSTLAVSGAVKAALPETTIVLGGPEVSFESESLLEKHPWVDIIIRGEGELTFEELLTRQSGNKGFEGILGISHRFCGKITRENDRPLITDLDILPSPFRSGCYGKGLGFTYYEASRGCPFRCSYCLSSVLGPLRQFSIERVFEDLDWFMESEYTQVRFADRTFNQDRKRALEIIRHILTNNRRGVCFHFELRADLLDESVIAALGEAPPGMFHLEIGVQSTLSAALEAVNRPSDLGLVAKNIVKLRTETRCHVHLDILAGMPGETFADFCQTLDDTFSWKTQTIQVGLTKVLKGTALEDLVRSGKLAVAPFPPYAVVRSDWLSAEHIVACQDIGRLVEGLYNPGRFPASLQFLISQCFKGKPSMFFQTLAGFWRNKGKPFYSFGPDAVFHGLKEFSDSLDDAGVVRKQAFGALVLHEFRMNQKVPSGKQEFQPTFQDPKGRLGIKLFPGLKGFWYEIDPVPFVENPSALLNKPVSGPVMYRYETDLSRPPSTGYLKKSLEERVLLACVEKARDFAEMVDICSRLGLEPVTEDRVKRTLDALMDEGLVIPLRK